MTGSYSATWTIFLKNGRRPRKKRDDQKKFLTRPVPPCESRNMPVQLSDFSNASELVRRGGSWICSACLTVNGPGKVDCPRCNKWRWEQLGLSRPEAEHLVEVLHADR